MYNMHCQAIGTGEGETVHTKSEINELIRLLEECYPESYCALEYEKDYELLFSTRLAAQCTDERVNTITPVLFERYPYCLNDTHHLKRSPAQT